MPGYSCECRDVELARCTLVVTCVVIRKDAGASEGEVLILKRSSHEKEGPGLWTIPGGKVRVSDLGEPLKVKGISHEIWMVDAAFERAVLREIKEETGIEVDFVSPLPGRKKIFIRKDGTPTLGLVYWTTCVPSTTVKIGSESTAYRWVREAELDDYQFIGNVKDDIRAALGHWAS